MNSLNRKFIILYRYHKDFDLVLQRIKLIKLIDPEIRLFGIFGGEYSKFKEAEDYFSDYFENNYLIKVEDGKWKWLHADITYQMWYNDVGKGIDFDFVAVMEWDLLYMEKIENLFPNIKENEIHVSGLIPLKKISKCWFWANSENYKKYLVFKGQVEKLHHKVPSEYAILGPGLCMPKSFLNDLSRIKLVDAYITDELKIPIWSQLLGYNLVSNNFYRNWFSFFEQKYFNANTINIDLKTIEKQLLKNNGRRAFHPFREKIESQTLYSKYSSALKRNGNTINNKRYKVKTICRYFYSLHCKMTALIYGKNAKLSY